MRWFMIRLLPGGLLSIGHVSEGMSIKEERKCIYTIMRVVFKRGIFWSGVFHL
jgi:hypothetical protein